jgi:hypothetical protein
MRLPWNVAQVVVKVLHDSLPKAYDHVGNLSSLPEEIGVRIAENAKIVRNKKGLRDQILIVLADYHDHIYASGALSRESTRINIADAIMKALCG